MYRVKDVMTDRPVTVAPEATIDDAISLLLDYRVSGLPVVDTEEHLLGVISEIDIIDLVYEGDIESSTVGDHMSRNVHTLQAEDSLDDAAGLFCGKPVRRFPVTDEGRLVGILSRRDLIRFVRKMRKQAVAHGPG